jgi:hypothetical protein
VHEVFIKHKGSQLGSNRTKDEGEGIGRAEKAPPFARRRDDAEISKETGSSDEGGQWLKARTNYGRVKRFLGMWFGSAFRDLL